MDELLEFLRARIAEDERTARAAVAPPWTVFVAGSIMSGTPPNDEEFCSVFGEGLEPDETTVEHVARHDPARVMRGVSAKRKLIAEFERCGPHTQGHIGLLAAIRIAAEEYADHPEYREEEWKP